MKKTLRKLSLAKETITRLTVVAALEGYSVHPNLPCDTGSFEGGACITQQTDDKS